MICCYPGTLGISLFMGPALLLAPETWISLYSLYSHVLLVQLLPQDSPQTTQKYLSPLSSNLAPSSRKPSLTLPNGSRTHTPFPGAGQHLSSITASVRLRYLFGGTVPGGPGLEACPAKFSHISMSRWRHAGARWGLPQWTRISIPNLYFEKKSTEQLVSK